MGILERVLESSIKKKKWKKSSAEKERKKKRRKTHKKKKGLAPVIDQWCSIEAAQGSHDHLSISKTTKYVCELNLYYNYLGLK